MYHTTATDRARARRAYLDSKAARERIAARLTARERRAEIRAERRAASREVWTAVNGAQS